MTTKPLHIAEAWSLSFAWSFTEAEIKKVHTMGVHEKRTAPMLRHIFKYTLVANINRACIFAKDKNVATNVKYSNVSHNYYNTQKENLQYKKYILSYALL